LPDENRETADSMNSFDIAPYDCIFEVPDRVVEPLSWVQHIPFAFFLVRSLKPSTLVELGTHTGNSYNAFCQAVKKEGLDTACHAVDTWGGDPQAGYYDESVYAELSTYQKRRYGGFSKLYRMTFDEAVRHFPVKSIDLLHIDGYHTYEAVKHDFETWLPRMSSRGVIVFHDTMVREGNFGVWKLWQALSQEYRSHNFPHGHGLGVISAGKEVDTEFMEFLEAAGRSDFYNKLFLNLGIRVETDYQKRVLENEVAAGNEKLAEIQASLSYRIVDRLRQYRLLMGIYKLFRPALSLFDRTGGKCT